MAGSRPLESTTSRMDRQYCDAIGLEVSSAVGHLTEKVFSTLTKFACQVAFAQASKKITADYI